MPFAYNPFEVEPVRANVLQEPQIHKEIRSLEEHIATLRTNIAESAERVKTLVSSSVAHPPPAQITQNDAKEQTEVLLAQDGQDVALDQKPRKHTGPKTSELYRTQGTLPKRFEEPDTWNYKIKQQHPLYTVTASQYGQHRPTVHDMPTVFHGQSSKFSEDLNMAGPYRNFSLNV